MCGDLESIEDVGAEQHFESFLRAAEEVIHEALEHRGAARACLAAGHAARALQPGALHHYMDGLFAESLRDCIADSRALESSERYQVLAAQAVVMARLAGFLAGRLDRREEPLRSCIEAMIAGYDA